MKKLIFLVLVMTVLDFARTDNAVMAQTVVTDTGKVKKPGLGKLYFSKKDSGLYVYVGRFKNLIPPAPSRDAVPPQEKGSQSGGKDKPVVIDDSDFKTGKNADKIKIPVGVIRWDSWGTGGGITPGLRGAFSFPETQDYAPWFSTFTAPEYLDFTVYNQNNGFKPENEKRLSSVSFGGDKAGIMEQEVAMARGAGIDFWAFNWYPDEAFQSYARKNFVFMPDKKGMKAAYITELVAEEKRIIDHFVWAFQQDWYQKIDGKPLLILAVNSAADREKQLAFYRAVKAACGCNIYTSWQSNDWASDKAVAVYQNGLNAGTLYGTWNGAPNGRREHKYIMEEELKEWNNFLAYDRMDLGLNVTISFSNAGVFRSPLNSRQADMTYQAEHSTGYLATDAENAEQLRAARDFIKAHPEKAKYMVIYSWNEHTEGVRTVSPRKKRDGTIDRSVLDVVGNWVE